MNARNIVISREQAETILDQETCDRLFAAGTDVRQVENACYDTVRGRSSSPCLRTRSSSSSCGAQYSAAWSPR